jgi:hypothetical protein
MLYSETRKQALTGKTDFSSIREMQDETLEVRKKTLIKLRYYLQLSNIVQTIGYRQVSKGSAKFVLLSPNTSF